MLLCEDKHLPKVRNKRLTK